MATICLNGQAIVDAIIDTGASKTIVDAETAKKMGLQGTIWCTGPDDTHFGSFHGPGPGECAYAGLVEGPVEVWFSDEVHVRIPVLYVVPKGREPICIVGTDLLQSHKVGNWMFQSVGHDRGRGYLGWHSPKGHFYKTALLNAPEAGCKPHKTVTPADAP